MNINLYINKQSARAEAPEIFSGAVGVLTVTLFGELDSSLTPVLRFMHESGEGYYTAKIENGCALVPHEVIQAPGFSIAVAGYENDGEEVIRFLPSEAVYIPVKENGYGNPDDAVSEEEESRSLIGQILSECQSVKGEVTAAKAALSKELSDAKDEMSDSILFTKEELERKYNDAKNKLDTVEGMLHEEESARDAADKALSDSLVAEAKARADADSALEEMIEKEKNALGVKLEDVADALLMEEYKRAEEDEKLCALLDDKVDKEDGVGLSAVYDISFLESPDNADNWYTVIEVLKQRGDSELKLYSKEQTDEKLAEKVSKEDGKGLSTVVSIDISESNDPEILSTAAIRRVNDLMGIPQTIAFYSASQIDKKLSELPSGGGNVDLSDYVKKEDGYGLSEIRYVSEIRCYDTVTNTDTFGGIGYETQNGEYHEILLYNQEQMDEKLSQKATMSDVEAYIEETLLGGAW